MFPAGAASSCQTLASRGREHGSPDLSKSSVDQLTGDFLGKQARPLPGCCERIWGGGGELAYGKANLPCNFCWRELAHIVEPLGARVKLEWPETRPQVERSAEPQHALVKMMVSGWRWLPPASFQSFGYGLFGGPRMRVFSLWFPLTTEKGVRLSPYVYSAGDIPNLFGGSLLKSLRDPPTPVNSPL